MKIRARLYYFGISFLLVIVLTGSFGWRATSAQENSPRYFPETGHIISGDFLAFYQNKEEADLLYGNPITGPFQDPTTNLMVQYFERARFELHPEAPAELRVQLSDLGHYLYDTPGEEVAIPEKFPACRTFVETGKQVCYDFLQFFLAHGGVAQFGYPISNLEIHEGLFVQYFQRARFEWRPELTAGERVKLTDVGSLYFDEHGESPSRKLAVLDVYDDYLLQTVLSLNARAFPADVVTASQGQQTVYVVVKDQKFHSVSDAQVALIIRLPDGNVQQHIFPTSTDSRGVAQYSFSFESTAQGIAELQVVVRYQALESKTSTSFRIWY